MVELIGTATILLVVFGVIGFLVYCIGKRHGWGTITGMSESKLINKFNKLVASINERNINTVKDELLAILVEYKTRKVDQFIESKKMLCHSEKTLNEQIAIIERNKRDVEDRAWKLKRNRNIEELSDEELSMGAMYMAQIDRTKKAKEKLDAALKHVIKQLEDLDKKIDNFNIKYELKKADINIMIATAVSIKNVGDIDIKLNDLIAEFNEKVSDAEIEHEIKAKVNNVTEDDDIMEDTQEAYLEMFKKF